jgi:type IV pilus assembly protein PilB
MAIIEAMTISDQVRKMVISQASTRDISKAAIEEGMRTLRMVGLDRVRDGITTLEQVMLITSAH